MRLQKVFRAGNSHVITIPTSMMKRWGLKTGNKVYVNQVGDKLILSKEPPKNQMEELKEWFEMFVEENGEILDELALR